MLKRILGTLAGIVVAMLVVTAMDALSHALFPESVAKSMEMADVAAAITQDFGTLQPAQARLRCVARNTDLICEFRDLDAGILDQREQHFQVYII